MVSIIIKSNVRSCCYIRDVKTAVVFCLSFRLLEIGEGMKYGDGCECEEVDYAQ